MLYTICRCQNLVSNMYYQYQKKISLKISTSINFKCMLTQCKSSILAVSSILPMKNQFVNRHIIIKET